MTGARASEQGDCTSVPTFPPPHSCAPTAQIFDLRRGVPYNLQIDNCCRDGVIAAFAQDPKNSLSIFQISVGRTGNTNTTINIPQKLIYLISVISSFRRIHSLATRAARSRMCFPPNFHLPMDYELPKLM